MLLKGFVVDKICGINSVRFLFILQLECSVSEENFLNYLNMCF